MSNNYTILSGITNLKWKKVSSDIVVINISCFKVAYLKCAFGLTNIAEFELGTDIYLADTDGDGIGDIAGNYNDGIPDDYEFSHGLNSKDASDATLDLDGDGHSNLVEYLAATDINDSSSSTSEHQQITATQQIY